MIGSFHADDVLKTVLSLYMTNVLQSQPNGGTPGQVIPLPTHEEVLICSEYTTEEEVTLLWKRSVHDQNYFRIFCLAHAERLSYQVSERALRALMDITQGKSGMHILTLTYNNGHVLVVSMCFVFTSSSYYIYLVC